MIDYTVIDQLEQGARVGEHLLLRDRLGRGAAGVVFEAWDEKLRRNVALKLPRSDAAARTLVTEGRALAGFRHEGLPMVHSIEEHLGIPFLVLERLRGRALNEIIQRHSPENPMPWQEAVHYLTAITEALQILHRAHFTHRDVKPENILVCLSGRVVLMDLGIALQEQDFSGDFDIQGTPAFIAPEMLTGNVKVGRGHLSDLYAIGIVAFELLTNMLPYRTTPVSKLLEETLHAPVPRVSDTRTDVPGSLDDLICALMAKSPDERPESTEAVQISLRVIAEGRSLGKKPRVLSVIMVDDDPDYRDLMRECAELIEHTIDLRMAPDGIVALELIRERPCDLIIVDLEMPRMSGLELCMFLNGAPSAGETLVAVMSGTAKPSDRALLSDLGVIDFIEKSSLSIEQMIERLDSLLARAAAAHFFRAPPRRGAADA